MVGVMMKLFRVFFAANLGVGLSMAIVMAWLESPVGGAFASIMMGTVGLIWTATCSPYKPSK